MREFKEDKKGASAIVGALAVMIVLAIAFAGYQIYTERKSVKSLETTVPSSTSSQSFSDGEITVPLEIEFTNESEYISPPISADYEIIVENTRVKQRMLEIGQIETNETKRENITFTIESENIKFVDNYVDNTFTSENFLVTIEGETTADLFLGTLPYSHPFKIKYQF